MVFSIGEILIDRFPGYQRLGGAPYNFATHLRRLGVPVRLISRIGKDPDGEQIRGVYDKNGFNVQDLQVDPARGTGRVVVDLDHQGVAKFDILTDVAYDYLRLDHLPDDPDWPATQLIYFGSLAQRSPMVAAQLQSILARRPPQARCFCDINLRPPHYTPATVTASLTSADILKLNDAECLEIGRMTGGPKETVDCARWLLKQYRLDLVAVTFGAAGSALVTASEVIEAPAVADIEVADTVGAGDGYAAILALGLLRGAALEKIAAAAADFAARICALPGAVPEDRRFYSENLVFKKADRRKNGP